MMKKKKWFELLTFVFVLDLALDPRNQLFGMKMPLFSLYLILMMIIHKPSPKFLMTVVALIIIQLLSYVSGRLFDIQPFDEGDAFSFFFVYAGFSLLLWYKKLNFLPYVDIASIIISIFCVVGFVSLLSYPELQAVIKDFVDEHGEFVLISHREFLGVRFEQFLYVSIPVVLIPASVRLYRFWTEKKGKLFNIIFALAALFSLFAGATRTLFMCIFLIIFANYVYTHRHKKIAKVLIIIISPVILYFAASLTIAALTENEQSNNEKYGHMRSYGVFYDNNPGTLLFGAGAGTGFYSEGAHAVIPLAEWTYMELIRFYGLIGGGFIIVFYFAPLYILFRRRKVLKLWFPLFIGYASYLLLSGSNPFLINSTGVLLVLLIYHEAYREETEQLYQERTKV